MNAPDPPKRFAVRQLANKWEVLIVPNDMWLTCDTEEDTRTVASAPVLEFECLTMTRRGEQFVQELESVASVFEKYQMAFGSRFFRVEAEKARRVS